MPASKGAPSSDPPTPPVEEAAAAAPKSAPAPAPAPEPAPREKEKAAPEAEALPGRLAPGPAEYVGPNEVVYLAVPLTAHPADDNRPATVFDWLDGAPDDGRWQLTTAKPNQLPDNEPADTVKEG